MSIGASDFTSDQITFIERLASGTGLDAGVIAAWVYSEENGSAALSYERKSFNNWLNVGAFDSGFGSVYYDPRWHDPNSAADSTAAFLKGTWGGASSGIRAILNFKGQAPSAQISAIQTSGWASSGYPNLPSTYASLSPALLHQLHAHIGGGGVAGAGGTGTPGNPTALTNGSPWTVGDQSNPDEDYWTASNRWAQSAAWYYFGDGEFLYCADGYRIMGQQPRAVITRLDPNVIYVEAVGDNTSFQYTHSHRKRAHIQRRTSLAKVTSPTQIIVRVICPPDKFRAGETVELAEDFRPDNGPWLIGNCLRSYFQPYSELTLVQAQMPLNVVTGTRYDTPYLQGQAAMAAGTDTVIRHMVSEAATIDSADYSYVYGGGHNSAGSPSGGGFDSAGAVAAVLAAGGLFAGAVPSGKGLVDYLLSHSYAVSGAGTGTVEVTLFDSAQHVFMRINGRYFGASDGVGTKSDVPNGGPGWIPNGQPGSGYRVTHIPKQILGQSANGAGASGAQMAFPMPKGIANAETSWTQDQGVDIATLGAGCGSIAPLFAVGAGTVISHGLSGFGPDAPVLQLDTPLQGQGYVYFGHSGPTGAVPVGTHVVEGQQIGSVGCGIVGISSGPHLEIGFCDSSGTPVPGTSSIMLALLKEAYAAS